MNVRKPAGSQGQSTSSLQSEATNSPRSGTSSSSHSGTSSSSHSGTSSSSHSGPPNSPQDCAICWGTCKNICYSCPCMHNFCLECLLRWCTIKFECALCKSPLTSIIYNVNSASDYEEYFFVNEQIVTINAEENGGPIDLLFGADEPIGQQLEPRVPSTVSLVSAASSERSTDEELDDEHLRNFQQVVHIVPLRPRNRRLRRSRRLIGQRREQQQLRGRLWRRRPGQRLERVELAENPRRQ